jgi:hypothetical protein
MYGLYGMSRVYGMSGMYGMYGMYSVYGLNLCVVCTVCTVCMVCMVCFVCYVCMVCMRGTLHRYIARPHLVIVHDHTACAHCAEIVHNHAPQKQHMNSDPNMLRVANSDPLRQCTTTAHRHNAQERRTLKMRLGGD